MLLDNENFVKILSEIKTDAAQRIDNYMKLAPFFQALSASEIAGELESIWRNIIEDKAAWQGELFTPQIYKRNKEKDIYLDILYPIKEALVWAVLYPSEVKNYYKVEGQSIVPTVTPKIHLFEKEYKIVEKVREQGLKEYIKTKISPTEKYKNGFTGAQMQAMFQYLVVGKFEAPRVKAALKEDKKTTAPKKKLKK